MPQRSLSTSQIAPRKSHPWSGNSMTIGLPFISSAEIRPCPKKESPCPLLSLGLDTPLGFTEPGSVTSWRNRSKTEVTRLTQLRKKLWCGANLVHERENKWAFCTATEMSNSSAHLACSPALPPPGKKTKKVVCAELWWKRCCCTSTGSWACRHKLKAWGSAAWAQFMAALALVFAECLLCIPPYARGGENTKKGKPWPLSSRVSQPGLEYRMNLQKIFCFRRIIDSKSYGCLKLERWLGQVLMAKL